MTHAPADIISGFPYADPKCKGCGKPLTVENAWMTDGCPCNTALGINSMNETRWRLLMTLQQQQAHALEIHRSPIAVPEAGEHRHCIVCATEKPWGVFDSKTGAAVCKECRDKARAHTPAAEPVEQHPFIEPLKFPKPTLTGEQGRELPDGPGVEQGRWPADARQAVEYWKREAEGWQRRAQAGDGEAEGYGGIAHDFLELKKRAEAAEAQLAEARAENLKLRCVASAAEESLAEERRLGTENEKSLTRQIQIGNAQLAALQAERDNLFTARQVSEKRRGVAIIVQRGSQVLTCLRKNCRDMNGRWQFGGGAVEHGETTMEAAYRELNEETGMLARSMRYVCDTFGYTPEGDPMWTSFYAADCDGYEPQNKEPERHGPWEWVEVEELLTRPIIDVMRPALAALQPKTEETP